MYNLINFGAVAHSSHNRMHTIVSKFMVQQLWITLLRKQGIEGLPIESAFEDLTVLASGSGIKEGERTISFFPASIPTFLTTSEIENLQSFLM